MMWIKHKDVFWVLSMLVVLNFSAASCMASTQYREVENEIETISVLAEADLAIPLSQISSLFTQGRPISIACNFGDSASQKKKIEDGESADIFITSQADLIQQLKTKGLVDVYSIGTIARQGEKTFTIAVVAGENMTPARVFLDFLKSPDAQGIFKKNGFTIP